MRRFANLLHYDEIQAYVNIDRVKHSRKLPLLAGKSDSDYISGLEVHSV